MPADLAIYITADQPSKRPGKTEATLTRLQPGMLVLAAGLRCRVVLVNDSRAKLQPVDRRERVVLPQTGKDAGKTVIIRERLPAFDVSPNSEVPILEVLADGHQE